jgi:N-acetylmuramoyl-L-alanine amidase
MKIGVNCGHTVSGTTGSGAVGYLNESNETRNIGYKVIAKLKGLGHTVIDCTNDRAASVNDNLKKIAKMANAQALDLFISIHLNAGGGQGCECYTYGGEKLDETEKICSQLESLGFKDRGVKDGSDLYVLRKTTAKAILIEVCFVDNKADAELYNEIGTTKIADAICNAIVGEAKPWYEDAQKWAVSAGITDGTRPDDAVTRAEIWTMLHRLNKKG